MQSFIDTRTLARIKDLPFASKAVAEGFLHGLRQSTQRGLGVEFSQYRSYDNGDDLARIDWKLFARSDRYFVREAERESELDIWFVLDSSHSMTQYSASNQAPSSKTSSPSLAWSKLEYAKYLIATMGYMAQMQGDSIGFLAMSDRGVNYLPATNGLRHWQKLNLELNRLKTGKYFVDLERVQAHLKNMRRRVMLFFISDFNQHDQEIAEFLGQLNSSRADIVGLHLECQDEIDFNYQGAVRFKDLESGEEVLVSASNAKIAYLANREKYQSDLASQLSQRSITYDRLNIDLPLDYGLMNFLKLRQKAGR